jgi:hypothetical protein
MTTNGRKPARPNCGAGDPFRRADAPRYTEAVFLSAFSFRTKGLRMRRLFWYWSLALVCLFGCMESLEKQTQKSPNSIIGKTTQDVGEYKPDAGAKVSDSKVRVDTPGLAAAQAYGPMLEQISKTSIAQALNYFNASEGRYPNSYDEFMTRIIKENNIRLPVLPGGKTYQYDVEKHELVVVDAPAEAAPGEPAPDAHP